MNKFEKVSFEQYKSGFVISDDFDDLLADELMISKLHEEYDGIKLPKRATRGSAGYDFYLPYDIFLKPGHSIKISTGIKCHVDHGWFLAIVPRSSIGFNYRVMLANTLGIIDEDYVYATNEGHIMIKLVNDGDRPLMLNAGDRFAQGIFLLYGITDDDDAVGERTGGIGSTN